MSDRGTGSNHKLHSSYTISVTPFSRVNIYTPAVGYTPPPPVVSVRPPDRHMGVCLCYLLLLLLQTPPPASPHSNQKGEYVLKHRLPRATCWALRKARRGRTLVAAFWRIFVSIVRIFSPRKTNGGERRNTNRLNPTFQWAYWKRSMGAVIY